MTGRRVAVNYLTAVVVAAVAGACASSRSSELDFDEKGAVTVQVIDDLLLVDETPVTLESLNRALDKAYEEKGVKGRRSALLLLRYALKPGENVVEFERRKQARTQEVLDALSNAGARNIHLGPVASEGARPSR